MFSLCCLIRNGKFFIVLEGNEVEVSKSYFETFNEIFNIGVDIYKTIDKLLDDVKENNEDEEVN